MADVLERYERGVPSRDQRETLEPLLDDLIRAHGFDRALVLVYDEAGTCLRGFFGVGVSDAAASALVVPIAEPDSPIVAALRGGFPQRVDDALADPRLSPAARDALVSMGFTSFVAAPLRSTADRRGHARQTPGWEGRSDTAGVVVLAKAGGIREADMDALTPFVRQAGEALTRERDVEVLQAASEAHAIETEWLWWMLNSVDDAVLLTDSSNDIIMLNKRAEAIFRAGDEDSPGKARAVFMNNFLFTAALSTWNLERGRRVTNREVTLVDPIEGSETIYEVIALPATNFRASARGTVSVLRNVTDIRHISEELARGTQRIQSAEQQIGIERDRLELILRNAPNPIIVVDNDNQIITMNAAAQRLFKPVAVTPRTSQIALGNDARFTSFLAELRLDPQAQKRGEILVVEPTTEEDLEMEVSAAEIRDNLGVVVATVSVMQDVGRLRELERRRLEQALFDSEKLAATGRLAASIAHEINNPLEAVQNALYLLDHRVPKSDAGREYLDIANRETQRMSRILRQMLGFYRAAESMSEVSLNALVEEAVGLVAKRLREHDVRIVKQLAPDIPPIRASGDQLKQVLLNLLLNAADAMLDGGTVTVSTQTGAGLETELLGAGAVQVQVRDSGAGIPEEQLARIFEPFFSTKPGRGTGLGLWVSRGIVQAHGGTLTVRSRLGRGTTFTLTLPLEGPRARAA